MTAPNVAASVLSALRCELIRGSMSDCPVQIPLALVALGDPERALRIADGLFDDEARNRVIEAVAVARAGRGTGGDAIDTCSLINDAASTARAAIAVLNLLPVIDTPFGDPPVASILEETPAGRGFAFARAWIERVMDPALSATLNGALCQVAARHPELRERLPGLLDDGRRALRPLGSSAAVDTALGGLTVAAARIGRSAMSLDLAQQISSDSRRAGALVGAASAAVRAGDTPDPFLEAAEQSAARLPPAGRATAAVEAVRIADLPAETADRVRDAALKSLRQVADVRRQVLLIAELIPLLPAGELTTVLADADQLLRGVRPEQRLSVRLSMAGSLLDAGLPGQAQQYLPSGPDDVPAAPDRATVLLIGRAATRLGRWDLLEWSLTSLAEPADRAMLRTAAIGLLGADHRDRRRSLVVAARSDCAAIGDRLTRAAAFAELATGIAAAAALSAESVRADDPAASGGAHELLEQALALVAATPRAGWTAEILGAIAVKCATDGRWPACRRAVLASTEPADRRAVLTAVSAVPGAAEQVDWFLGLLAEFRPADESLELFAASATRANRAEQAMDIALLLPDAGGPGSRSGLRQQLVEQIIVNAARVGDVTFAQDASEYLSAPNDRARVIATVIALAVERRQLLVARGLRDLLPAGPFADDADAELAVGEAAGGDVETATLRLSGLTDPLQRARTAISIAGVLLPTGRVTQAREILDDVIAVAKSPASQPFRAELYNEMGRRLYQAGELDLFLEILPRTMLAVDLTPVTDSLVAAALDDDDPDLASRVVHELGLRRSGFVNDFGQTATRHLAAIAVAALRSNNFGLVGRMALPLPEPQRRDLLASAVRAAAVADDRAAMIDLAEQLVGSGDASPIAVLALTLAAQDGLCGAATELVDTVMRGPGRDQAFADIAVSAAEAGDFDEAHCLVRRIALRAPERPAALVRCSVVAMTRADIAAFRRLLEDSPSAAITVAMVRAAAMTAATHRPELIATVIQAVDADLPAHEQEQLEAVLVEAVMAAAQAGADVRSIAEVLGLAGEGGRAALPVGSATEPFDPVSTSGRTVVARQREPATLSSVLEVVRLAASQDQLRLARALALAAPDPADQADALRVIAGVLVEAGKYAEAVDLLSRVSRANPRDAALQAVVDSACGNGRYRDALIAARAITDKALRVRVLTDVAQAAAANWNAGSENLEVAFTAATDIKGERGQLGLLVRLVAQAVAAIPDGALPDAVVPEAVVPEDVVPEAVVPEAVVPDDAVINAGIRSLMGVLIRDGADWDAVGVLQAVAPEFGRDTLAWLIVRLCGVGLTAELCVAAAEVDDAVIDLLLAEFEHRPTNPVRLSP